jgi:hypothetical protein
VLGEERGTCIGFLERLADGFLGEPQALPKLYPLLLVHPPRLLDHARHHQAGLDNVVLVAPVAALVAVERVRVIPVLALAWGKGSNFLVAPEGTADCPEITALREWLLITVTGNPLGSFFDLGVLAQLSLLAASGNDFGGVKA